MIRIEDALKQTKPFDSPYQKVLVNLIFTHSWAKKGLQSFFSEYELTGQQYNVLRILKGAQKAISTSEIRERLVEQMSDTSRMVDRLESKGLVEKSRCDKDKRLVDVRITNQGRALLQKISKANKRLGRIAGKLTKSEAEQLSGLLDKMRS